MKTSSEKSFGLLFFSFFLIIGLWPLLNASPIKIWSIILSFIILIIVFFKPSLLRTLNKIWIKLGELLGKLIAPIIMALVFFIIVTPISFFVRILGKDLLMLKFSKNNSYWIKRQKNITTMDKQF